MQIFVVGVQGVQTRSPEMITPAHEDFSLDFYNFKPSVKACR